jgi:hypothetical protein
MQMNFTSVARRTGRALMTLTLAVAAVSVTSPGTAYARHGDGAAIALGIIGGALAGAAIASSGAPGYYGAPPAYYPYAPPTYAVAPAPAYYYSPPAAVYYAPPPYYGPAYYYGDY